MPETVGGDQPQGNAILEEQYRKLAQLLGLECARFDLTQHPDPFTVEVDVATVLPAPYEVVKWRFGIGATHTARATGAWRFPGDGRTLLVFEVRPLTAYPEEVTS